MRIRVTRNFLTQPDRLLTRHRYVENISTTAVSDAFNQDWRFFDLSDPNYTGVGHQPYMVDQMTQWYSNYIVRAVKVVYRGYCNQSDAGAPSFYQPVIGHEPLRDKAPGTGATPAYSVMREAKNLLRGQRFLPIVLYETKAQFRPPKKVILSAYYTAKDIASDPDDPGRIGGQSAGNPTAPSDTTGAIHTYGRSASTTQWVVVAELTYYVEWFNKRQQAQS